MTSVVTRSFKPSRDAGFVYSSCPKSIYYGNSSRKDDSMAKDRWFKDFYSYLNKELIAADIRIACMEDDPYTILGYSIVNNGILQFIYVKQMFRKHGIARLLLKGHQISGLNDKNITDIGLSIISEHPNLFKKDLKNEEKKNENNDIRQTQAPEILV